MAKEINLVPDIKDEFIKALKFRNLVFFLCIIVASVSMVVILVFLSIAGGQQGFINAKQNTIGLLEEKITSYDDLSDFLTIRDQLTNIGAITENKVLMSRVFNVLSALIPTGADTINISELAVAMDGVESGEEESSGNPALSFEAQADAGAPPYIDYNVLNAFKKSMQYMRYDYGEYVDKNDLTIPSYCIIEKGSDGSILRDISKGYYAYWLIEGEGCNPSATDDEEEAEEAEEPETDEDEVVEDTEDTNTSPWLQSNTQSQSNLLQSPSLSTNTTLTNPSSLATDTVSQSTPEELKSRTGYDIEQYNGQNVVRIWRTPQYTDWYKSEPGENDAYMDLDGTIHNIPHFNSSCIKYSGAEKDNDSSTIVWTAINDECRLVPDGSDGIVTSDSSNGRSEGGGLVLRFSAVISLAPEVFNFNNHHMIALSPSGYRNVTDSYTQIQNIFTERAADCKKNDTECITTPVSSPNGSNSSNSNSSNASDSSNNSNNSNNNSSNNSSPNANNDSQYYEEEEEEEEEEW